MDQETAFHLKDLWMWTYDHIAVVGLFLGGLLGMAVWSAKQILSRYATTKAVEDLAVENAEAHSDIKHTMMQCKNEILEKILELHRK